MNPVIPAPSSELPDVPIGLIDEQREREHDHEREGEEPDEDAVRERGAEDASADGRVAAGSAPADLRDRLERPPRGRAMRECDRPRTRPADPGVVGRLVRQLRELRREGTRLVFRRHGGRRLVSAS